MLFHQNICPKVTTAPASGILSRHKDIQWKRKALLCLNIWHKKLAQKCYCWLLWDKIRSHVHILNQPLSKTIRLALTSKHVSFYGTKDGILLKNSTELRIGTMLLLRFKEILRESLLLARQISVFTAWCNLTITWFLLP